MAKRSHTTELGCIACADLNSVGAGKESWLVENANILTALETHSLAIANRSLILVLGWLDGGDRVKIRPELSPIESESVTAIEWLVFDDVKVLAVATSLGYLMFFSLDGDFIFKQLIYHSRILKLRVGGNKKDLTHEASAEDVCVVMPGVIARFDGSDIQRMLQRWVQEAHAQFWDQKPKRRDPEEFANAYGRIPYQIWSVNKYGSCADAAITGIMPPPLMELPLILLLGSQVKDFIVQSLLERML